MEETILRHEVIKQMDTGDPFDLVFITADKRRGTGGVIKRVDNWVKSKGNHPDEHYPGKPPPSKTGRSVDPDHRRHKTFNIMNPADLDQHPVKVHWRLMQKFNGKRILQ